MNEKIERKIIEFLEKKKELVSIKDVSNGVKISYPTTLRYVDVLAERGILDVRKIKGIRFISLKGDKE